jgi:hypothetical protein
VPIRRVPSPTKPIQETSSRLEIFSGWKEIANYLGKGIRTVQRYELKLGLPIHRPNGRSIGSVIATKAELDGWVKAAPTRVGSMPKRRLTEQTNRLGARFLQVDTEIALTFSGLALAASDEGKRRSATQTARTAYNSIMRLRQGIELTDAQREKLDANLQRLKSELQRLGQRF